MPNKIAKLFKNGRSQAVRLPHDFRFEGDEVYIRRDAITGDVILSKKQGTWDDFFALRNATPIPPDFMEDRPLNKPLKPRDTFGEFS